MFVGAADYIDSMGEDAVESLTVYGTELKSNSVRVAKMNLAIHGLEGDIVEGNSFYFDPQQVGWKV